MTDNAAPVDSVSVAGDRRIEPADRITPYAFYALALLTAANFLNYVDRKLISIVAEAIKTDLSLSDAQLGFLLGTAFGVVYGVAGLAIGRLADVTSRAKLMALGLAFWSAMTAASGVAVNFSQMAAARLGIGMGEATCNPCSHALLMDIFPARHRSMVLGTLLLGTLFGMGFSLFFGGLVLDQWSTLCRSLPSGACGIANWKAAFFIIGLPGLLVAVLVATLKEPKRAARKSSRGLGSIAVAEFSASVPPFTLANLWKAGGWGALVRNLALLVAIVACVVALGRLTGDWAQWIAVGIGVYSVWSWAHSLSLRDRPLFKLTYGCPTFSLTLAGAALVSCINGTIQIWAAPYAMRTFGVSASQVGVFIGLAFVVSAGIGVTTGGWLTDRWKLRDRRAPIWMMLIGLIGPMPSLVLMMSTADFHVFAAGFLGFGVLSHVWSGGAAALAQDLTLSRMRGTAAASFSLLIILIGSALGPYAAGKISALTGSLSTGLLSLLVLAPFSVVLLMLAARRLPMETEEARKARARSFGEPI